MFCFWFFFAREGKGGKSREVSEITCSSYFPRSAPTTARPNRKKKKARTRDKMAETIEARFKKAVWLIRNGPAEKSSNETKLLFYSYFKQVKK